jgi:hypothetical protein
MQGFFVWCFPHGVDVFFYFRNSDGIILLPYKVFASFHFQTTTIRNQGSSDTLRRGSRYSLMGCGRPGKRC